VAARRADDDGDLADGHAPDPVPRDHAAGTEPTSGFGLEAGQRPERGHFVGLVVEADHPPTADSIGSDPADEQGDAAELGRGERPGSGGDREGA
jgi:hypothetical protein